MKQILILATLLTIGCTRRPLSDVECPLQRESVEIEVNVDWSATDFDPQSDDIHRVSFRFFPQGGGKAFDRYLEGNVERGVIDVPIGDYSVVVFNESVNDTYWHNAIAFENADSYSLFAARLVDEERDRFDFFYSPTDDENLSVEALELASYSVDNFVVSKTMTSRAIAQWSTQDRAMASKLNPATPRRLTCWTEVAVATQNLSSAYVVHASLSSLAQRVFMASGDTDSETTTHITQLTEREWEDADNKQHGTISQRRLTFSTPSDEQQHTLKLDVLLVDGSRYAPEEPMEYDVSDQVRGSVATRYADNDISATVSLSLPKVSGDIEVEGWGDENKVTIQ